MVLFSLAFQSNILTEELFQQLLLIVLISMLATPALANVAQCLVNNQCSVKGKSSKVSVKAPIVIAGFGRVGHRIGEILSLAGEPFVALDFNASIVKSEHAKGHPVFYGDVRKPGLLEAAGAKDALIVIVTLNDLDATEQVVSSLRKTHPDIEIYVRGHSLNQCRKLRQLGASGAVSENVEASLELSRMVLNNIGLDKKEQESIIGGFRRAYYARIDDEVR